MFVTSDLINTIFT